MLIEFHDGDVENEFAGTLSGCVSQNCSIEHGYQAEVIVQNAFGDFDCIQRAYVFDGHHVCVICAKDPNGNLCCIGRNDFDEEWQLPDLYPSKNKVISLVLGRDALTFEQAEYYANLYLVQRDVAAVVLFSDGGIMAAWEEDDEGAVLIAAKGPWHKNLILTLPS